MTYLYRDLWDMWEAMRNAQREQAGADLTMRDLLAVFKVGSLNTVNYRLKMLVEAGFVVKVERGSRHIYRAKETLENN
jgi:predicted transcriptional regulator